MGTVSYRPVVFSAGGESAVCGGRHFRARPAEGKGFSVHEVLGGEDEFLFYCPDLGSIRDDVEALVTDDLLYDAIYVLNLAKSALLGAYGEPVDGASMQSEIAVSAITEIRELLKRIS